MRDRKLLSSHTGTQCVVSLSNCVFVLETTNVQVAALILDSLTSPTSAISSSFDAVY